MNQRQLRKTLAGFYSKKFDTGTDLLTHVVQQIVEHAGIEITGGRVWRLRTAAFAYELVAQVGSVHKIRERYRIRARFVAHDKPTSIMIANVVGSIDPWPSPGYAVFTLGGREHRLHRVVLARRQGDARALEIDRSMHGLGGHLAPVL